MGWSELMCVFRKAADVYASSRRRRRRVKVGQRRVRIQVALQLKCDGSVSAVVNSK